jgi:hypothetical protein
MQMMWTIEAKADFADPEKNAAIAEAIRQHAVALHATLSLIKDNGVSPQVVCFSDDWFHGHSDISLMKNTLGGVTEGQPGLAEQDEVSDELAAAARELAQK